MTVRPLTSERDRWLTPPVRGIGAASLLSDLGHEVPTALLPSFLTSTLGAPAAALGLIEGVADGLAGVAKLARRRAGGRPARRRATAVGGYTATAVLSALIGVATAAWQVGVLRAGAWAARGLRVPSRNALLADAVPPAAYGRAYGFERAMDNLGAIGGPLLALALVAAVGVREAILLSIIPGLLAALAIVYAVRHVRQAPSAASVSRSASGSVRCCGAGSAALMRGVGAFELGNIAATLLILRATELLTPGRGARHAPSRSRSCSTPATTSPPRSRASPPAGSATGAARVRVLRRRRRCVRVRPTSCSRRPARASPCSSPASSSPGMGIGCVETAEHAAVARSPPSRSRGSAFGLLAAAQSFGNLAASAIAGLLWTLVSPDGGVHLRGRMDGDRGGPLGGSRRPGYGARRVIRHAGPSGV